MNHRRRVFVNKICCVWDENPDWLEYGLGLIAMVIGVFVSLPFRTSSPPFSMLGLLLPEFLWGSLLFVMGFVQVTSVCLCQESPYRLKTEAYGSIAGAIYWAILAIYTMLDNWTHVVWVAYGVFSMLWILIIFKLPLDIFDEIGDWLEKTFTSAASEKKGS